MSFDGTGNGDDDSLKNILTLLERFRGRAQPPSDPFADYQVMVARNARLPKTGGLFGSGYARFMADYASQLALANSSSAPPPVLPTGQTISGSLPQLDYGASVDRSLFDPQSNDAGVFDRGLAGPTDGAELIEVGNPANRRLRREEERRSGQPWPRDPETGRNYDVAHIKAIADGGTNTLDNIRPMHPAEHRAQHMADGDHARWGRRGAIARAFSGTVARALTPLEIILGITGILSGRIRTDSFDDFSSDLMGWPSKEDQRKAFEHQQRQLDPNWKPGDFVV